MTRNIFMTTHAEERMIERLAIDSYQMRMEWCRQAFERGNVISREISYKTGCPETITNRVYKNCQWVFVEDRRLLVTVIPMKGKTSYEICN